MGAGAIPPAWVQVDDNGLLTDRGSVFKRSKSEDDVASDPKVAGSRDTGGVGDPDQPDQNSVTGTTPNEEFVGRVQGTDVGYAGETGAERRAQAAKESGNS
jgi:hypothetical protein